MLYGMADPIKEAIQSLGYRVRIYTPYGQLLPGMAYLVRRLLENSSNDSFLRASFADGLSEEVLLRNPAEVAVDTRPLSAEKTTMISTNGQTAPMSQNGQRASDAGHFRNDPPTDFSKEANREAMKAALAAVRGQLGRTYPAVVNNRPLPVGKTLDSVNPSRSTEIVGRAAAATVDQAKAAVAAALAAFDDWRDTPIEERAGLLRRTASAVPPAAVRAFRVDCPGDRQTVARSRCRCGRGDRLLRLLRCGSRADCSPRTAGMCQVRTMPTSTNPGESRW
jgi:RHH-type proline utilization regulon transcriptional repressor/proline dehydrogenase/delta 1-pyrroline-5-carboxylate dehydrogenase